MITVEEKEGIRRLFYLEHKSIRWIARALRCARKTVRRALADGSAPVYQQEKSRPSPKMGPFTQQVEHWLAEDLNNPAKQHLTARRIYQLLCAEPGFEAGESTVRRWVRLRRQEMKPPEVFIPLFYEPGMDAQCDFGEALFYLGGESVTAQLFCLRLCYSKQPFVMAFPHQRQEAFFEGHAAAFRFFQGVPHRIWYDNLKTAVNRVLTGRDREEQNAFVGLRSHYLFESRFCTPSEGHEKGLVEGIVGYARRNFLVPVPRVESWDELNAHLLTRCQAEEGRRLRGEEETVGALWNKERPGLLPLPERAYACCTVHVVRTNRFGLATFETNRYSVPPEHAHGQLLLKAYTWRIEIAAQDKVIAVHQRCYGREQDILDPLHYLPLLAMKPRAFEQAKALREWRTRWPEVYNTYHQALVERLGDSEGTREFIRVLQLHRDHAPDLIQQAVEEASQYKAYSFDAVHHMLLQAIRPVPVVSPLDLAAQPALASVALPIPDLSHFDQLLQTERGG
jgi:transposase